MKSSGITIALQFFILFYVCTIPFQYTVSDFISSNNTYFPSVSFVVGLLMAIVFLIRTFTERKITYTTFWPAFIVAFIFSVDFFMHDSSISQTHKTIIANLLIIYLILIEIERSGFKFAEKLLVIFVVVCSIASFICLLSDDFFISGFSGDMDIDYGQIVLNRTPNETSLCILTGLGAAFFMIDRYIKNNSNKQIIFLFLSICLMSVSIVDLASRTAALGLILLFISWTLISLYNKRNRLKVFLISFTLLMFMVTVLLSDTVLRSRLLDNQRSEQTKTVAPADPHLKTVALTLAPADPQLNVTAPHQVVTCKLKLTNEMKLSDNTSATLHLGGRRQGYEFANEILDDNMIFGVGHQNYECIRLKYGIAGPSNLIIDVIIISGITGCLVLMLPFFLIIYRIKKSQMKLLQTNATLITCCLGVPVGISAMLENSHLFKDWWIGLAFIIAYWSVTLKNINNLDDNVYDR